MSKAYDHIKWQFLRNMMLKLDFHPAWVERIMLCVSTMSYHVIQNGEELGPIHPKRGLRQGDPLSPYPFIICAQGLCNTLSSLEARGLIHDCKVPRGAPIISHLLFVDDSYLFFRANIQECLLIGLEK